MMRILIAHGLAHYFAWPCIYVWFRHQKEQFGRVAMKWLHLESRVKIDYSCSSWYTLWDNIHLAIAQL